MSTPRSNSLEAFQVKKPDLPTDRKRVSRALGAAGLRGLTDRELASLLSMPYARRRRDELCLRLRVVDSGRSVKIRTAKGSITHHTLWVHWDHATDDQRARAEIELKVRKDSSVTEGEVAELRRMWKVYFESSGMMPTTLLAFMLREALLPRMWRAVSPKQKRAYRRSLLRSRGLLKKERS